MWSIVNQITRDSDTSVILTTHSMEEADALCGKIGIMVDGYFKCMGSSQHLKRKFGQGYQLEVRARMVEGESAEEITRKVDNILKSLRSTFSDFEVLERQELKLRVVIRNLNLLNGAQIGLGQLFGIIELNKEALQIEDYSISQTTLEQIFNQVCWAGSFSLCSSTY